MKTQSHQIEAMSDTNEKEWWEEDLKLAITQSAPFTHLKLWEDADFDWLQKKVAYIIAEAERRKVKEIREEIEKVDVTDPNGRKIYAFLAGFWHARSSFLSLHCLKDE